MKSILLLTLFTLSLLSQKIDALETQLHSDPDNIELKFKLAVSLHDAVTREENGSYTERSEELLNEILTQKKDHVEAMAYLGSLFTLKGRDAWIPWNKLKFVEQGCDKMDKAISIASDNPKLRILRAMNNINLPDFFNRLTYCLEDFKYLRQDDIFNRLDPNIQLQILYFSAKAFEKNKEVTPAVEMYQKVVALNGSSRLANRAKASLKELTE